MQREGIERCGALWGAGAPRDLLILREELQRGDGQYGKVQRMAYGTRGIWTTGVVMKNRASRCEIQHRQAGQNGYRANECAPTRLHVFIVRH